MGGGFPFIRVWSQNRLLSGVVQVCPSFFRERWVGGGGVGVRRREDGERWRWRPEGKRVEEPDTGRGQRRWELRT